MSKYKNIGIFGGSFNPVHNTHLEIAEAFLEQMSLDICYFVPTNVSPFKTEQQEKSLFTATQRIEMLKLALKYKEEFQIDSYEIDEKGISFTIKTIEYFKGRFPDSTLYFLIGTDQAVHFRKWKYWNKICSLAQLCIVPRKGIVINKEEILKELAVNKRQPKFIDYVENDLSSTHINGLIKAKENISRLVPYSVEKYIRNKFSF